MIADAVWVQGQLSRIPRQWRGRVEKLHGRRLAKREQFPAGLGMRSEIERAANEWLRGTVAKVDRLKVPVNLTDEELCDKADQLARECMNLAGHAWIKTPEAIRERLAAFVALYGLPCPAEDIQDGPAIARMTHGQWWRRGLRVAQARALEEAAIGLGYVHRNGEIYASNATVERRGQQRRRNAAMLDQTKAVNKDTGEVFNLGELAARSVANPRIRRGELMTRIAGFEAVAKGRGDSAEFVTLTCPSRFHAMRQEGARVGVNPKHDGSTPRQAQGYLTRIWAAIRAKLGRLGVRPYGFRIAEPHHDGTPHWHMVLFVAIEAVTALRDVIRDYALRMDGDEPGAQKNRVEFVTIDPARGSAAGYVAKYVSKNIDGGGYEVQKDLEGFDSIVPVARVEAWASTWGIRQFQQIGGPPVGVWRELRRIPDGAAVSPVVEAARAAADCGTIKGHDVDGAAGNWRSFVEIMGGPVVERDSLPLRVAYTSQGERWDYAAALPYPAPVNRYGEPGAAAVYGVRDVAEDRAYASVRYRWEIKRKGGPVFGSVEVEACGNLGSGSHAGSRSAFAFDLGPEFSAPRTRVNNCTRVKKIGTCRAELDAVFAGVGWIWSDENGGGYVRSGDLYGGPDNGACDPGRRVLRVGTVAQI